MPTPTTLYKYMPCRYLRAFLARGALLFRNLTYFRKVEDLGRGDLLESLHMDFPDNPVTIEVINRPLKWVGRAAFLNSINADRLLIFCLSELLSDQLFAEFGADACVEITDPAEFLRRVDRTVAAQRRFAESGPLHGPVEYYNPNRPVVGNVKDPKQIPFFKHAAYSHQREYRLAVSLKRGLRLTERIVLPSHDLEGEVTTGREASRVVHIGSIADITTVHRVHARSFGAV